MLKRLLARARNYLILGLVGAVAVLTLVLLVQAAGIERLTTKLEAQELEINTLNASISNLEANYAIVRGTLDYMDEDEQEARRVQNHEEAYVRNSTGSTDDLFSGGWNDFFEFLRDKDGSDTTPDG